MAPGPITHPLFIAVPSSTIALGPIIDDSMEQWDPIRAEERMTELEMVEWGEREAPGAMIERWIVVVIGSGPDLLCAIKERVWDL